MLDGVRRVFVFGVRHGFKLLAGFLVVGYGLSLLSSGPVAATPDERRDPKIEKLKEQALGAGSLNKRLMALEGIRLSGSGEAVDALAAVARKGKTPVASAACAQLGRVRSAAAKSKLKGLLEDISLDSRVRDAAASSIAVHWKERGDLSYLEEKCSGSKRLEDRVRMLKAKVYGR